MVCPLHTYRNTREKGVVVVPTWKFHQIKNPWYLGSQWYKWGLLRYPQVDYLKKVVFWPNLVRSTASPQVGASSGSKRSKHYYGCKYDLRYITQSSTGNENGLKCKLGPKCGENIQNLADAPSFYDTASPQVRSGWDGKPSKHYCGFKYDLRCTIQYSTGTENGL